MPLGQEQISLLLKLGVHELELVLWTNQSKQTNAVGHSDWGSVILEGEAKSPRKAPPPADQTVLSACCRSNLLNMSTTRSVLPNLNYLVPAHRFSCHAAQSCQASVINKSLVIHCVDQTSDHHAEVACIAAWNIEGAVHKYRKNLHSSDFAE